MNNYGMREVADLTHYDLTTGKPFLYMDYALTSSNEFTGTSEYAYGGKGHNKRLKFDGQRESTLTVTTSIFNWTIISLISGASVTTGAANVYRREVKKMTLGKVVTTNLPIAGSVFAYPKAKDGDQASSCVITLSGSDVTITSGATNGDDVVVYYLTAAGVTTDKISFTTTSFPKSCKLIGDTVIKNEATTANEPFQFIAYKASPQPNFSITMASEGSPTEISITYDLLADSEGRLIDYLRYDLA